MRKRAQITIFIILAIVLAVSVVLLAWFSGDVEEPNGVDVECAIDSECVPNECCDADNCVPFAARPDCVVGGTGILCQPGCKSYVSGTLGGCMRTPGTCACVNQKCIAQFG